MAGLRDTAESMARLSPKKGKTHPWWAVAEAVLAVLDDSRMAQAAETMEETYKRRVDDEDQ